jgi:predicted DNA-binding protein (UPF0251 family)
MFIIECRSRAVRDGEGRRIANVPRPHKIRQCRGFTGDRVYKPKQIPMSDLEVVRLELSELEAMRLCDVERFDQEEAGRQMGVSRGTVQRLLKSGRTKLVSAVLESKAILIQRGDHDEALHPHGR